MPPKKTGPNHFRILKPLAKLFIIMINKLIDYEGEPGVGTPFNVNPAFPVHTLKSSLELVHCHASNSSRPAYIERDAIEWNRRDGRDGLVATAFVIEPLFAWWHFFTAKGWIAPTIWIINCRAISGWRRLSSDEAIFRQSPTTSNLRVS
jgi:hypothetical protein